MSSSSEWPSFTLSTLNPRSRYSPASSTVAAASLIPMVIDVGSASCGRGRARPPAAPRAVSPTDRAARCRPRRVRRARRGSARGAPGTTRPARGRCVPRATASAGSASAASHASQVSPVTNSSGDGRAAEPVEPSSVSMRTMPLRTESTVRNAIVYGRESSKCSVHVLMRRMFIERSRCDGRMMELRAVRPRGARQGGPRRARCSVGRSRPRFPPPLPNSRPMRSPQP